MSSAVQPVNAQNTALYTQKLITEKGVDALFCNKLAD